MEQSYVETWMMFVSSGDDLFDSREDADNFYETLYEVFDDAGYPELAAFSRDMHYRVTTQKALIDMTQIMDDASTCGLSPESLACIELQEGTLLHYLHFMQKHATYVREPSSKSEAVNRMTRSMKKVLLRKANNLRMIDFDYYEQRYPMSLVRPIREIYPQFPNYLLLSQSALGNVFGQEIDDETFSVYSYVHGTCVAVQRTWRHRKSLGSLHIE